MSIDGKPVPDLISHFEQTVAFSLGEHWTTPLAKDALFPEIARGPVDPETGPCLGPSPSYPMGSSSSLGAGWYVIIMGLPPGEHRLEYARRGRWQRRSARWSDTAGRIVVATTTYGSSATIRIRRASAVLPSPGSWPLPRRLVAGLRACGLSRRLATQLRAYRARFMSGRSHGRRRPRPARRPYGINDAM